MVTALNPFIWDRPLDDPSKIIGMEAFANQVALILKGQTNVALFGPRDTGKTTFTNVENAHSLYLEALAELGLVGFVLRLSLVGQRPGAVALALACLVAIAIPLATSNAVTASRNAAAHGDSLLALRDAQQAADIESGAASPQVQPGSSSPASRLRTVELKLRLERCCAPARLTPTHRCSPMSVEPDSENELSPGERQLADRLSASRPLPAADLRGSLGGHLGAFDPGHCPRPERLRTMVVVYMIVGLALIAVGALLGVGSL
jgi:hypothetical protein